MLLVNVRVRYEGDWTAQLAEFDVFGEFLASTFRNRRYIGIVSLDSPHIDSVLDVVRNHETVMDLTVVERYSSPDGRTMVTAYITGRLSEFTPLQTLLYEGFLPIGPTKLEDGYEEFDLLLDDRDELSDAVDVLDEFGAVSVNQISREFRREITPSVTEWHELLAEIPPRQRAVLNLALERGYFEIPREVTLEELADELDITKTTAANHLRKAERRVMSFLIKYVNLSSPSDTDR